MGRFASTNRLERGENMKFLLMWSWTCRDAKEVTERFKIWKPVGDVKFLFPIHTMIGANKAFTIVDGDSAEVMQRNVAWWTDVCTFEFYPIIDSREAVALS